MRSLGPMHTSCPDSPIKDPLTRKIKEDEKEQKQLVRKASDDELEITDNYKDELAQFTMGFSRVAYFEV